MPDVIRLKGVLRDALPLARVAAASKLAPETIHLMSKEQLLRVQEASGLGTQWGTIVIPAEWCTPGTAQAMAYRRIDASALEGNPADIELACEALCRYALILLLSKVAGRGNKMTFLAPDTIRGSLVAFRSLLTEALLLTPRANGELLSRLDPKVVLKMPRASVMLSELNRLQRLVSGGLWSDCPPAEALGEVEDNIQESLARKRALKAKKGGTFKPLADKFVAEAGWRLIWLVETLGVSLLKCSRELVAVRRVAYEAGSADKRTRDVRLQRASTEVLQSWRWQSPSGEDVEGLPFAVQITRSFGPSNRSAAFEWPPTMYVDFLKLLHILQDAHLFVFLLSTGGRISEALSLDPKCIVSVVEGREAVQGKTYKLVFNNAGQKREWPLPALAVHAIQQQIELAEILTALGEKKKSRSRQQAPDAIWVSGNGAKVAELPTKRMMKSMRAIGVLDLLDGKALNSHRFRKTLARLVALAIVGAPKILMDLFGHKSIEMTLHYMTTDPQLRAEIAEVARAQTLMLAESAIRESETNGGGGGKRLREAVRKERVRLGRDFNEDDIRQLAETLTDNGTTWMLVRPGVICTKSMGQSGPCNKSVGRPEPSRCRAQCGHRLEDAALHDDVDLSIEDSVGYLTQAIADEDEIQAEMWRGQVLTHLPRFEDLRVKWSSHPVVADLLKQTAMNAGVAA